MSAAKERDEMTGAEVRRIREQTLGIGRDVFAARAGVAAGTLERFENGTARTQKAQRLAIIAAVRSAVEDLEKAREAGTSASDAVADIIKSAGETPSDLFREFAARMAPKPVREQWLMAESFAIAMAARAVQGDRPRESQDE